MSRDNGTIGWDVGGAHLKAAAVDGNGTLLWIKQLPVPLWQGFGHLDDAVRQIAGLSESARFEHAITMTGELVDLFDDRGQGVVALATHMARLLPGADLRLYAGGRGFVEVAQASVAAAEIASANWHATGAWLAASHPRGVLVDIGSTTTDILPFSDGRLSNRGYSDRERLARDELVYTGIVRTPVMAVVRRVPLGGEWVSLANEHFATMADVYRILELLPEGADRHPSADGRDKSARASMRRLARMVGADLQDAEDGDWRCLAAFVADRQLGAIADACWRQLSRQGAGNPPLFGAGVGKHLVGRLAQRLGCEAVDVDLSLGQAEQDGISAATCAPAVAVARLAQRWRLACAC